MTPSERNVALFFQELGLAAVKIPEADERRPDLLVSGDELEYLVEVKAKGPPEKWVGDLATSGRASGDLPLANSGPLSRMFANAAEQLHTFDPARGRVRFLAVEVDPRWREIATQLEVAAYGSRDAVSLAGSVRRVLCVDPPQFARFDALDVLLIFLEDGVRALLNAYSPMYETARKTKVVKTLAPCVFDPPAPVREGAALVFPEDWRALASSEKEERFRKQHGLSLVQFTSYSETVITSLGDPDDGEGSAG